VVRVFSLTIVLAVSYPGGVSKLRRPFLSNRYFFIAVWLLKRRCGLIIDRVRIPSDPRTRI